MNAIDENAIDEKNIAITITKDVCVEDPLHVILDALSALSQNIHAGARPWEDYEGAAEDDPKASEESYLGLLALADSAVEVMLNRSTSLPTWSEVIAPYELQKQAGVSA